MLLIVWTVSRVVLAAKSGKRDVAASEMTPLRTNLLRLATASLIPVYIYYFSDALDRFSMPLPGWLLWLGNLMLAAAVALFIWSHVSLGRAWTAEVNIAQGQTLVTGGPYRWVRHPMYSALLLMGVALVFATGNPVASLPYAISMTALYLERVGDEELMMQREFGDEYERYRQRTGRIVPRIAR